MYYKNVAVSQCISGALLLGLAGLQAVLAVVVLMRTLTTLYHHTVVD